MSEFRTKPASISRSSTKIKVNRIRCTKCNDVIESSHRHDFKYCKCGSVAVDGGHEYLRRLGDTFEELSEEVNE